MNKKFWIAALKRAGHAVAQTLSSTIPAGFVITPVMIETLDIKMLYCVIAWLATGLLAGCISMLKSIAIGVPEVKDGL